MNESQQEFCAALKAARERRGLKLTDISDVTKVCPSYFSALERNDLRVWPKGLFRRSFFRGYVTVVGLPVEPMLEEFVRLFPEDERAAASPAAPSAPGSASAPAAPSSDCRLVLDDSWSGVRPPIKTRVYAAILDAITVAALAAGTAWSAAVPAPTALAVAAMTYFMLATVLLAESPARFCLRRGERLVGAIRAAIAMIAPAPKPAAAESDAHDDRQWITDARRVRPRGQAPGLRVRFKVSS